MDRIDAKIKNSLSLALIGDAVESLWLRQNFVERGDLNVNIITKRINKIVNAGAQAESLELIKGNLTSDELDVIKRARNTHTHSTAKNYSVIEYRHATAFEALLGYLYLTCQHDRIEKIMQTVKSHFDF